MVVATGVTRVVDASNATNKPQAVQAVPRKGLFARFVEALMVSRMQQARREIRQHRHLLPLGFDEQDEGPAKTKSGDMPIGGW